jgi:nucleotide-binding universal stress UspA family protein
MFPIRAILVPVDFSPKSVSAAEYAAGMAAQLGAKLKILHVLPPLEYEFSMIEPVHGRAGEKISGPAARVQTELEQIPRLAAGVSVDRLLVEGDPATEIVRLAKSEQADLIVMPTHGRGAIRRFLLGSVVAKVLHDCECAVWTGTHWGGGEPFVIRQILCAVDLGPLSRSVFCGALGLSRLLGSRLSVLHATPRLGFETGDYFDQNWHPRLTEMARDQLRKITQDAGAEPDLVLERGDPDKVVAEVAKRMEADLVVIGRGKAAEGRLRANAYAIIRHAPCPVLSI